MALLLSLVMALSLVPTTVWAAGVSTEVADDGISVQYSIDGDYKVEFRMYYSGKFVTVADAYVPCGENTVTAHYEWSDSQNAWVIVFEQNGTTVPYTSSTYYQNYNSYYGRKNSSSYYVSAIWKVYATISDADMSDISWSYTSPKTGNGTGTTVYANGSTGAIKASANINYVVQNTTDVVGSATYKPGAYGKVTLNNNSDIIKNNVPSGYSLVANQSVSVTTTKDSVSPNPIVFYVTKNAPQPPTEPAAPTGDELKEAIGKIQVEDTPKAGITNHGTENFDLIDQSYTMTDVADSKVTVTIMADKYVAAYNVLHPNHTNAGALSVALTLEKSGDKWSVVDGKTPVTFVVECNEEEGPGETEPNFSDAKVIVKCVANNDNHKTLTEKQYSITEGDYTANYNHENGHTCTVTLKRASFIGNFDTDTGFTHKDKAPTTEITFTWTWSSEKGWVLDSEVARLIECECETTVEKFPVYVAIYRNGNFEKLEKSVYLGEREKHSVITVDELNALNIADYYTAQTTGGYDYYGWYNDGMWNVYKKNPTNPPALCDIPVNGYTNIKVMVYDKEKVVYFQTKEALADYQKDHSKTEGRLFSTTARKGSALPTADAPTATREGYTFLHWSKEGQITNVTGQTVGGWTNLYANWEVTKYTITYDYRDKDITNKTWLQPSNPTSYTIESDTIILNPITAKGESGKTFLEWRDANDGTGKKIEKIEKGTTGNLTIYAYWNYPVNYTVLDKDGKKIDALCCTEYFAEGESDKYTLRAAPAKDGYTFDGWYQSAEDMKDGVKLITGLMGGDKKYELCGKLTPNANTPYVVEHYQEQLDGTYTLVETETLKGTTDTTVTAVAKSYTGFTYDETVKGTVKSGPIAGNGSLVLKLYYTRNSYTVTFQPDNGDKTTTTKVDYGAKVTKPADPTKSGYIFDGWYEDGSKTAFDFNTIITENKTLKAKWSQRYEPNPLKPSSTTKTDGKKVESGKTFDAGIAMYVGLSILSVTGSAVVIRKRKDF